MTAMGFDFVPGALAGALALREAGRGATRVDVGYFSLGAGADSASAGTRASLVGATLNDNHAYRDGSVRTVRPAERVRDFTVKGKARTRDLGRRRRALHAPAGAPGAARGQRLPGLVRRARQAAAGRHAGRDRRAQAAGRAQRAAGRRRAARLARGRARGRHHPRHAVLDRRRRLRRGGRAARRGPPHRHRRLRLHRLVPGLGRAARRGRQPPARGRRRRAGRGVRPRRARAGLRRGGAHAALRDARPPCSAGERQRRLGRGGEGPAG